MKKIFVMILALCLLCGATAFATTLNPSNTSGETILTTTINETYTLTIPSTLNIAFNATETPLELTVSNYRLKAENMILLGQNWDGTLNSGSNSLSYSLKYNGTNVSSNNNPVTFTGNGTVELIVAITEAAWNSAAAGEYTDTVTFTSSIVSK